MHTGHRVVCATDEAHDLGEAGPEVVVESQRPVRLVVAAEVVGRVSHHEDEVAQPGPGGGVPLRAQVGREIVGIDERDEVIASPRSSSCSDLERRRASRQGSRGSLYKVDPARAGDVARDGDRRPPATARPGAPRAQEVHHRDVGAVHGHVTAFEGDRVHLGDRSRGRGTRENAPAASWRPHDPHGSWVITNFSSSSSTWMVAKLPWSIPAHVRMRASGSAARCRAGIHASSVWSPASRIDASNSSTPWVRYTWRQERADRVEPRVVLGA